MLKQQVKVQTQYNRHLVNLLVSLLINKVPVVISSDDPDAILGAFLEWSDWRQTVRTRLQ